MGTSSSSRGPGGRSPLVPPWADIDGAGPGPAAEERRFSSFRSNLGGFVVRGDQQDLMRALGHYARTATGGAGTGSRRFGAVAASGGALFTALSELSAGGTAKEVVDVDLSVLNGGDTNVAIQEIVRVLTPPNGDAEKIRKAMQTALVDCLEGLDEFDPSRITDDMLIDMIIIYAQESVFGQIVLDSGRAFQRVASPARVIEAEGDLHTLVAVTVDKHMRPLFAGQVRMLRRPAIEEIILKAIAAVWTEWESFE